MNTTIKDSISAYTYFDTQNNKNSGKSLLLKLIKKDKDIYLSRRLFKLHQQVKYLETVKAKLDLQVSNTNMDMYSEDIYNDITVLYAFIAEHRDEDADFISFLTIVAANTSSRVKKYKDIKHQIQVLAFKISTINSRINNLTNNYSKYDTILDEINGI